MFKFISFDLDRTLVKNTYPDKVWLEGLPEIYSIDKNLDFEAAKKLIFGKYDEIGNSRVEWYDLDYWIKKFNLKINKRDLLEKYRFEIEVYPDAEQVLEFFQKRFNLIIISNAKREFIDIELDQTGFSKYFKRIFSSTSDYNKVKNEKSFYLKICDVLKISPSEIIHIGDNKNFDYDIPRSIGIKAFLLDRNNIGNEKYVVHDLFDFKEKVKKITQSNGL
jgi:putative hydrolase of the HAD superfamily